MNKILCKYITKGKFNEILRNLHNQVKIWW